MTRETELTPRRAGAEDAEFAFRVLKETRRDRDAAPQDLCEIRIKACVTCGKLDNMRA
jgi:hypothetical protein